MNPLYDEYPHEVLLNGKKREIVTDFKDWLRFVDMLKDDGLSDQEKFQVMLAFYLEDIPLQDQSEAARPLVGFFRMEDDIDQVGERPEEEESEAEAGALSRPKPLYDFRFDAKYIISGFWHDYRIDLTTVNMHWWKFRILLDGLSADTEFKQRVMYRNVNAADIKDVKERSRILKIQRQVAIPQPKPTDFEIGDAFW